jgi:hypothetical protein
VAALVACEPLGVRATTLLVLGREVLVGIGVHRAPGGIAGVAQLDAGFEAGSMRAAREHHRTSAAAACADAFDALAEAFVASYQKAATTSANTPRRIGQLELMGALFSPNALQCTHGAKREQTPSSRKMWGARGPGCIPMRRQ